MSQWSNPAWPEPPAPSNFVKPAKNDYQYTLPGNKYLRVFQSEAQAPAAGPGVPPGVAYQGAIPMQPMMDAVGRSAYGGQQLQYTPMSVQSVQAVQSMQQYPAAAAPPKYASPTSGAVNTLVQGATPNNNINSNNNNNLNSNNSSNNPNNSTNSSSNNTNAQFHMHADQWDQLALGVRQQHSEGGRTKPRAKSLDASDTLAHEEEAEEGASRARAQSASGRAGKVAKRSRMGCLTCRQRKKRCCETRPKCKECLRLRLNCVWPKPGTEHKNKPKEVKNQENMIDHDVYGKIRVLRGIVEYRSD